MEGMNCAEAQPLRATLLMAEVIVFWTCFVLHTFPQIFMICMSARKLGMDVAEDPAEENEESDEEPEKAQ